MYPRFSVFIPLNDARRLSRLFHLGCMKGNFRLSERGTIQQREHPDETGLAWRNRLTNKNLRLDQEIITY
jgi:hypothetical protein